MLGVGGERAESRGEGRLKLTGLLNGGTLTSSFARSNARDIDGPEETMNQDDANLSHEDENQEADAGQLIRLNEHDSYDPQLNTIGLTGMLEGVDLKKLDRQAQSFADQENAHGWTVVSDYFATGEGRHVYYLRSFASSETEARDHFRARFFKDASDEHWNWMLIGLELHRGAFWPEYLTGFQIPPDELEMHWQSQL
jgi:hypothetical protein